MYLMRNIYNYYQKLILQTYHGVERVDLKRTSNMETVFIVCDNSSTVIDILHILNWYVLCRLHIWYAHLEKLKVFLLFVFISFKQIVDKQQPNKAWGKMLTLDRPLWRVHS